jgi:hypothetical protein
MQETAVLQLLSSGVTNAEYWLDVVAASYSQSVISTPHFNYGLFKNQDFSAMRLDVARSIAASPDKYPRALVNIAEARCRINVSSHIEPVAKIAEIEQWFKV